MKHGYGTECYAEGDRYEGYFFEGEKHGKGKIIFQDGSLFNGEFIRNYMHVRRLKNEKN